MDGHYSTSVEELKEFYDAPSERVMNKQIDHLDENCRASLSASPFFLLATFVSVFADSISLSGTISPSGLVLGDVGFARPEPQDFELTGDDLSSLPVSEERIPDMDGDVIFVYVTDQAAYESLRENRLRQTLEAVRNGNVHPVTSTAWFVPGLFAANAVLDDIEGAVT